VLTADRGIQKLRVFPHKSPAEIGVVAFTAEFRRPNRRHIGMILAETVWPVSPVSQDLI
jgi:hypothetical protein